MIQKGQNEPYLLIIGDVEDMQQAFLVIDNQVKYEVPSDDIVFALLSSFFVFNICYCKGTFSFFQFLETILLNCNHAKLNPSVTHFLSLIQ